jgi:serine/threonine protein phosphatase PrpC
MENYYEQMTYLAVYDGHGQHGKTASELANNSIKEALEQRKEELAKMSEEDVPDFFMKMMLKVQEKFKADASVRC